MRDLPDRDDCSYCFETRRLDPRLLGCMGHFPNFSSKHLKSRDEMDEVRAGRALLTRVFTRHPKAIATAVLDAAFGEDS